VRPGGTPGEVRVQVPFPYAGEFLSLLTAVTWAGSVILFRRCGETAHPAALNLFKSCVGFCLFLPTMWFAGLSFTSEAPVEDLAIVCLSGVLGLGLSDTMFFRALNLMGAGMNAVVDCFYPVVVVGLAAAWLGESMSALQLAGLAAVVLAVLFVTVERRARPVPRRDLIAGLMWSWGAMVLVAISFVMIKPILDRSPFLWVTTWRILGGIASILLNIAILSNRREVLASVLHPKGFRFLIPASVLGGYVTMLLWLAGASFTDASIASALNQTSAIFIVLFAALFLDEPLTRARVSGICLGFCGALVVTFG